MSIYRPADGGPIEVAIAETVRRQRQRQAIRLRLLAARRAGLKARHRDRLRRAGVGDTTGRTTT